MGLLVVTFVIVLWNVFLPLSSNRNSEFLDYMGSLIKKEYKSNDFIQKNIQEPIVKPLSDNLEHVGLIDNPNPGPNTGQRQSETNQKHQVILTFYVEYGNQQNLPALMDLLVENHINKAVFFIEKRFMDEHEFIVKWIQSQGYLVKTWTNLDGYDSIYSPTVFKGIPLVESEVLTRVNTDRDAVELLRVTTHYYNSSIVAFTPKIMTHKIILEDILKENGKSLDFSDSLGDLGNFGPTIQSSNENKITEVYSPDNSLQVNFDPVLSLLEKDQLNGFMIDSGTWTLSTLHGVYPRIVQFNASQGAYIVSEPIIFGNKTNLIINDSKVLLKSNSGKIGDPSFIVIRGNAQIINSTISSWDPVISAPDPDPYNPRPYILILNGHLNILNSSISYLGYSLHGLNNTRYAHAALEYYNSRDFVLANSTISFNYYGFYSEDSKNFKIENNHVYGQTRYGLDPHTRSKDFIVDSNYIHDNGNQGIICSLYCSNVTITNNKVEHNVEGIGLHWLTNSSLIKDNIVRYNEKYGIFIQKQSFDNLITGNIIIGNKIGLGILNGSGNNSFINNTLVDNIAGDVKVDPDSQPNIIKDNQIYTSKNPDAIPEKIKSLMSEILGR